MYECERHSNEWSVMHTNSNCPVCEMEKKYKDEIKKLKTILNKGNNNEKE